MHLRQIWWSLLILVFFLSCEREDPYVPVVDDTPVISEFAFLRQNNPGLISNVFLEQQDSIFSGTLPEGAKIKAMIASFELKDGYKAFIEGIEQFPGVSINDFSNGKTYKIIGPEGNFQNFQVNLHFVTKLPVIYINTENHETIWSKDYYINASIEVDGSDLFEDITAPIEIRGRGNSTWGLHPKKPYQIKFQDKKSMLGMPEDKRWLLLAEYSDKTFLRNRTAFELGYLSDLEWTPHGEFADVYLNGSYNGLYYITQKVEESKNRVNITNDGYLLEIDQLERLDPGDIYFYTDHFLINIKDPDLTEHGPKSEYIKRFVLDFEDALFGNNFKNPYLGYRKFIDVNTVVDWFIINEIAKNVDARWFSSIFFYKAPGENIKMGPIWDFDLGFGNVNYADSEYPEGWWVKNNPWIDRMCEDPYFTSLVKERYQYFREHEAYLYDIMDETSAYFSKSMEENYERWPTMGQWVWPNPVVYNTYEQELNYLKNWISERLQWMDSAVPGL
jgi:hypothetical protein